MAAKDARVESTGAWVKLTDAAIATLDIIQNVSKAPAEVRVSIAQPAATDPGIIWPGEAVELAYAVPGFIATEEVWFRPAGGRPRVEMYVKHA